MKAAVFQGIGKPLVVEDVPDPAPGPTEVVIKVGRCGICGTDVHLTEEHAFAPPAGTVLGHEYSGEVVALGSDVNNLKVGDRITAMPLAGCGQCSACLSGHPIACKQMFPMYGGLAEYARASAAFSTKLPEALSLADGALVEPLAVASRSVTLSRLKAGDTVVIMGVGSIGLATIFWARQLGAGKIIATARSKWRESLALQMGADAFVVSDENLLENVKSLLGGAQPDIVYEAAGAAGLIAAAINIVRPWGKVLVEGGCMKTDQFVPFGAMIKEITMQFAVAYTMADFKRAVTALESGYVEPRSMITETVPLTGAPAALESIRQSSDKIKVHIAPWGTQ